MNVTKLRSVSPPPHRSWRWSHGLLFLFVVQGAGVLLGRLSSGLPVVKDEDSRAEAADYLTFYRRQRQFVLAPPAQAFGPIWIVNNLAAIWGLLRVLNLPPQNDGRGAFLKLQAASWLDLMVFNAAAVAPRSNINALVLTSGYLALTVASLVVARFRLRDTKVALSLTPLSIWLLLATGVGIPQVLWNRDLLYRVGPFTAPHPRWLKGSPAALFTRAGGRGTPTRGGQDS